MGKYYSVPKWCFSQSEDGLLHFRGGERERMAPIDKNDIDVIIPEQYLHELGLFLYEQGYIRPQMNNESRAEDLKIVSRLLDILEKK